MPAILPPSSRPRFDLDAIDRLATLLAEECEQRGGMPLEAVDGLLCGALVSPGEPIPLEELLPLVLGSLDAVASEELTGLLERLWEFALARIVRSPTLDPEQNMPLILLPDEEDAPGEAAVDSPQSADAEDENPFVFLAGAAWALGFSFAYRLRAEAWEARIEDDQDLWMAVMDIFDLIPPDWLAEDEDDGAEAGEDAPDGEENPDFLDDEEDFREFDFDPDEDEDDLEDQDAPLSPDERLDIIASIPEMLHAFHLCRIEESTPRIPRRAVPAPGRNDPCPCGSGRKFKKCHGDPSRLN